MSKTITISVSDELYVLIQKFKQNISVSKICQEALMEQTNCLQMAESGDLIAFLKSSKAEFTQDFVFEGQVFARECISEKLVNYATFITLTELAEDLEVKSDDVIAINCKTVKEVLEEEKCSKLLEILEDYAEGQKKYKKGFDEGAFLLGFIYEVDAVWQRLKNKL